jgi:hypothetical protein
MAMTCDALFLILSSIKIFDRKFKITNTMVDLDGSGAWVDAWFIQVTYLEADVETGEPTIQESREWLVKPTATETDVVRTAYAAVSRSYAHVVSEHFTYKGKRVFGPHIDVDALLDASTHVH